MSSLLARAQADIDIAKLLLSPEGNPSNDEMITDQAAYHAQKGIEKAMKYQTEMMGIEYKKVIKNEGNLKCFTCPIFKKGQSLNA